MPEKRGIEQDSSSKPRTRMYFSTAKEASACHMSLIDEEQHEDDTMSAKLFKNRRFTFHHPQTQHRGIHFDESAPEKSVPTDPGSVVISSKSRAILEVPRERRVTSSPAISSSSSSVIGGWDSCSPIDCRMQLFREKLKDESLPAGERMKYRKCLERFERRVERSQKL